jgi:ABC-2 type transport system ATP-binding protein
MSPRALDLQRVTKVYPNGLVATNDLTLSAERGEVVGLVGPNGAGKTTLVRQILGLLPSSSGSIHVLGHTMPGESDNLKGLIGYVPQMPVRFPSLTVEETVSSVLRFLGKPKMHAMAETRRILDEVGLGESRGKYGYQLSFGSVKLMNIAMALCQDPELLILDEPTSMVDVVNRSRVRSLLRRQSSRCILITSHDLTDIESLCDRAYVIANGRFIASGSPDELSQLATAMVLLEATFGDPQGIRNMLPGDGNRATWDDSRFRMLCTSLHQAADVLATICSLDARIESLSIRAPAFAEAIMELLESVNATGVDTDHPRTEDH